ncbi:hypothetical protein B484DRAFT_92888 [Ochromonadaceae sp. CCMP2298]|nr:hypothetical protein B484DRAFT_92888 [Ochromonadaceae sp. CCMP2298]
MSDVNLRSILRNPGHLKALMSCGPEYGIHLSRTAERKGHRNNHDNVINLGSIPQETVPIVQADVPVGYEEEVRVTRQWREPVTLSFRANVGFLPSSNAVAELAAFQVLPENGPDKPRLTFVIDSSDGSVRLRVGEALQLSFHIDMEGGFTGQLKRVLAFTFDVTDSRPPFLVSVRTRVTLGVLLLGAVVPQHVDRALLPKELPAPPSLLGPPSQLSRCGGCGCMGETCCPMLPSYSAASLACPTALHSLTLLSY